MPTQSDQPERPTPPEDLDAEALLEWGRICDELAAAGCPDLAAYRAILTVYVQTWETHQTVMRFVRQHGPIVKFSNGVTGASPFHKAARECAAQLRGLLTDLGLTPAARGARKGSNAAEPDELDI